MLLLNDICEIWSGFSFRGSVADEAGGSVVVVQLRDVDWETETVAWDALPRIAASSLGSHRLLQPGDILIAAKGQTNRAVLVSESGVAASTFFVARVSREDFVPAYVTWALNAAPAQAHFDVCARGGSIRSVTKACLGAAPIPAPPVETQRRIAEVQRLALHERRLTADLSALRSRYADEASLRAASSF